MSLERLSEQGRLRRHKTTKEEVDSLLRLVERDLQDASVTDLSADRRFATAYNAVLQSATIMLLCEGYRPHGVGHHSAVLEATKEIMGKDYRKLIDYFDACRVKRNITDYTRCGGISKAEADELAEEARAFSKTVRGWLKTNHPEMLSTP